jgi:hypothetical protein
MKCCDDEGCDVHKDQREQSLFREQVMNGTSDVQRQAKGKRSKSIEKKGRLFREPGFTYIGDTVIIWSLREYLANPKWKEDALRKSSKRRARNGHRTHPIIVGNNRKRFRRVMEGLYKASLEESTLLDR